MIITAQHVHRLELADDITGQFRRQLWLFGPERVEDFKRLIIEPVFNRFFRQFYGDLWIILSYPRGKLPLHVLVLIVPSGVTPVFGQGHFSHAQKLERQLAILLREKINQLLSDTGRVTRLSTSNTSSLFEFLNIGSVLSDDLIHDLIDQNACTLLIVFPEQLDSHPQGEVPIFIAIK